MLRKLNLAFGCLNSQGKLDDGRIIAVKKLSRSSRQGKKEFLNEAKMLASMQHKNVVNLLGYCVHGEEKLLVYEYVVNESLDKLLFSKFCFTSPRLCYSAGNFLNYVYMQLDI